MDDGKLRVACAEGSLVFDLVQPAGRRPMAGGAFAAGRSAPLLFGATGGPAPSAPLVLPV